MKAFCCKFVTAFVTSSCFKFCLCDLLVLVGVEGPGMRDEGLGIENRGLGLRYWTKGIRNKK